MFCIKRSQLSIRAAFAVVLAAISLQAQARPLDAISGEERLSRLNEITHVPWDGQVTEKDNGGSFGCRKTEVDITYVDPTDGVRRPLRINMFSPGTNDRIPAVLVIPTILGTTQLEPIIGNRLCRAGMAALVADVNDTSQPQEMPSWGIEDVKNRRALVALRTVLDYAERSPRFDPNRLAIMGSSMGGITSAMLAGLEPQRLKAIIINVGGGNLPFTLAYSDNGTVGELRKRRMEHMRTGDPAAYEEQLRLTVKYDPIYFAGSAVRERVLVVQARRDVSVPFVIQEELASALGEPSKIVYDSGHVDAIVSLVLWRMGEVVDFLNSRFEGRSMNIFVKELEPESAAQPAPLL